MLVDVEGRVRSWGRGSTGRLGHGSRDGSVVNVATPQVIASLAKERVVCVAVGGSYSMVLTAAGSLYSFGKNTKGQLGLGHKHDVNEPVQVAIGAVKSVCAGYTHTAAITRAGSLWSWARDHRPTNDQGEGGGVDGGKSLIHT